MKKHLNEDAPRLVVAVPSLQPVFALYNTTTHELKRVYGGNVCENSVYTAGSMPKSFRIAAEDQNYHHEIILSPLPDTIEETILAENPECTLVITDYRMQAIQEQEQEQTGRMVRHPEADNALLRMAELYSKKKEKEYQKKRGKNKDPKHHYLPLFDQPLDQTA